MSVTADDVLRVARHYFDKGRCSGHDQFNGRYCRDAAGPERWCIHCAGFMLLESVAGRGTGDASLHARLTGLIAQWRESSDKFFAIVADSGYWAGIGEGHRTCADALDAVLRDGDEVTDE